MADKTYVMRKGMELPAFRAHDACGVAWLLYELGPDAAVNVYDDVGSRNYLTDVERSDVARELIQIGGNPAVYRCLDIGPSAV